MIQRYDYKPDRFNKKHVPRESKTNRLFLGFELEVGKRGDRHVEDASAYVDSVGKHDDGSPYLYCKSDGSIQGYGFEIVSHPSTLKQHTKNMEILKRIGRHLTESGFRSSHSTTGLHVHVNRDFFNGREEEIKLAMFCHLFKDNIFSFAGRTSNQYCREEKLLFDCLAEDYTTTCGGSYERRYQALNFFNEHTIEFRMFRGHRATSWLGSCLTFCDCLCRYIKTVDLEQILDITTSWSNFTKTIPSEIFDGYYSMEGALTRSVTFKDIALMDDLKVSKELYTKTTELLNTLSNTLIEVYNKAIATKDKAVLSAIKECSRHNYESYGSLDVVIRGVRRDTSCLSTVLASILMFEVGNYRCNKKVLKKSTAFLYDLVKAQAKDGALDYKLNASILHYTLYCIPRIGFGYDADTVYTHSKALTNFVAHLSENMPMITSGTSKQKVCSPVPHCSVPRETEPQICSALNIVSNEHSRYLTDNQIDGYTYCVIPMGGELTDVRCERGRWVYERPDGYYSTDTSRDASIRSYLESHRREGDTLSCNRLANNSRSGRLNMRFTNYRWVEC